MKPRIRRFGWTPSGAQVWMCMDLAGLCFFGNTPKRAYDAWSRHAARHQ